MTTIDNGVVIGGAQSVHGIGLPVVNGGHVGGNLLVSGDSTVSGFTAP